MSAFLWAALGVVGGSGLAAVGDMVSEEVRDRLDHLPHAILRLAARQLNESQRADLYVDGGRPRSSYRAASSCPVQPSRDVHQGIQAGQASVTDSSDQEQPDGLPGATRQD